MGGSDENNPSVLRPTNFQGNLLHRWPTSNSLAPRYILNTPGKQKEVKNLIPSVVNPSVLEDCTIIDVDDYNGGNDFLVPMFVKHTKAMLEEIDRMEEVEMEDIETEEAMMDIDDCDKMNPLVVVGGG
uniref:Uncharacterized protein n=1 Tax=Nelumbo nucifera TaxID=4432 RepID=A0A822YHL4_NELNU|nr:TPA_asm: hypothetical protein HUJ06_009640 [Nelumbo nucifera]